MNAQDLCPSCCQHVATPLTTEPIERSEVPSVVCEYRCRCGHTWTTSWALSLEDLT